MRAARHGAVTLVAAVVAALAVAIQPPARSAGQDGPTRLAGPPGPAELRTTLFSSDPLLIASWMEAATALLLPSNAPAAARSPGGVGDALRGIGSDLVAHLGTAADPPDLADADHLTIGEIAVVPSSGDDGAPSSGEASGLLQTFTYQWGRPGVEDVAAAAPAALPYVDSGPLFRFRWPLDGEITTYFGERGPLSPRGHAGLDIANVWGAPVRAVEEGRVVAALAVETGYGWHVIIDHGNETTSLYGHLSAFEVDEGQWVARGQRIGAVGSTGLSTGPHLHFELRRRGRLQDPLLLLP